jgi:hypothetical protein
MALPKGRLTKVSSLPPIVVEVLAPAEPIVIRGDDGMRGEDGVAGRDAPSVEELLPYILKDEGLLATIIKHIQEEIGRQVPEGMLTGGVHKGGAGFHIGDLPGYKKASVGDVFGVGAGNAAGFYDPTAIGIVSGEDVPYTRLIDTVGDIKYIGEATPGTAEGAALWRVKRVEFLVADDIEIKWAAGTSTFDKVWTNRLAESYS